MIIFVYKFLAGIHRSDALFFHCIKLMSSMLLHFRVLLLNFANNKYFVYRYFETVYLYICICISIPSSSSNFSFILVWTHDFLLYSMGFKSLLSLFTMMLKFSQWEPFEGSVSFWYFPHYSLSTSLLLGTKRLKLLLYILCPGHGINLFYKDPWFLLMENGI